MEMNIYWPSILGNSRFQFFKYLTVLSSHVYTLYCFYTW